LYILAIDTSTETASVCLLKGDQVLFDERDSGRFAHNQRLFEMISNVLDRAGIGISEVDLFAVGSGPGSFTGLRVGMSAVKGLAAGSGKKVLPVPSIDAAALRAFGIYSEEYRVNIVIEGRQKDFFHALYEKTGNDVKKISEIIIHHYEKNPYIEGMSAGNVSAEFVNAEKYSSSCEPDAVYVGKLAYLRKENAPDSLDFEPEYYKDFKIR
jgi:tRNA threonylcarbamoyl adenosine modification protein YeaZ